MAVSAGFRSFVRDALSRYGAITDRSMFGDVTVYCDGDTVAILDEDQLWLKADAETLAEFNDAGLEQFIFTMKDGSSATMNFFLAPDDFFDDFDVMDRWMALARQAGRRAAARKRPARQKKTKRDI